MICRSCAAHTDQVVVDLGSAPLSNGYLTAETLNEPEVWFPLRVMVCGECWLVQVEECLAPSDIFASDYAYFSSYSQDWLQHCRRYAQDVTRWLRLSERSFVVEIASNDGCLLENFVRRSIPCLGVEPTASTAAAARGRGVETLEEFFGLHVAEVIVASRGGADLVIANNVLAHVPRPVDFLKAVAVLLKPGGTATFEFPHLLNMLTMRQFDTIYHEHFSYLSLIAVQVMLASCGLEAFKVELLPTHGGSLRLYVQHEGSERPIDSSVPDLLDREGEAGIDTNSAYKELASSTLDVKRDFLGFLLGAQAQGKVVVGYGAAAKGNTLLNFAGVRPDLLAFIAERNPSKQGKYMPGSRIPIVDEAQLRATQPDYIVILPWNIKGEVSGQLDYARAWGAQFVTAVPHLTIEP